MEAEATLHSLPRWVGAYAEKAIAARGNLELVRQLLDDSPIPMVIYDDDRRYVEANHPAEVALGMSRDELRRRRLDDLTPAHLIPALHAGWARLMETGVWAGPYDSGQPESGTWLGIVYYCLANLLPGQHFNVFAPMGWPGAHTSAEVLVDANGGSAALTPRELEVLQLAATGRNGPMIADELVVSQATVNTHFQHIYHKLAVRDRGAAVAKGMRQGLIS
jgi:DNA-binding CsgD family transcriptional regulator